jgi:hypothetical protein
MTERNLRKDGVGILDGVFLYGDCIIPNLSKLLNLTKFVFNNFPFPAEISTEFIQVFNIYIFLFPYVNINNSQRPIFLFKFRTNIIL